MRSRFLAVIGGSAVAAAYLTLLAPAQPALATSITVNTALDPAPDANGHFPSDGKCSLRAAIEAAANNSDAHDTDCATGLGNGVLDSIHINANLAGSTMTMTYAQPFTPVIGADNPMEIIGPTTHSADFVINGNNATRIFLFGLPGQGNTAGTRADVKLANLTVQGGNGVGEGGFAGFYPAGDGGAAVMSAGTHLTLDNVVFRNNTASGSARGGAIYAYEDSVITNNGGAYVNNHASGNGGTGPGGGRGGAVFFFDGASRLDGYAVLFEGNSATYSGGAISAATGLDNTVFHLERGLLKDNSAIVGGVYSTESTLSGTVLEISDSTVTGNSASQSGGVFFSLSTNQGFQMLRDTFVSNTGSSNSGLVYSGTGLIANSIIKDTTCHSNGGAGYSGNTLRSSGTTTGCPSGVAVTGLSSTLAQNGGPEVQRTFRLTAGSNAIDTGNEAYCGTIDARSLPRGTDGDGTLNSPAHGDCDIGAYEYVQYVVNFATGTSQVLEGATASVQVKLTIPDPADRPLPSNVVVPITRDQ